MRIHSIVALVLLTAAMSAGADGVCDPSGFACPTFVLNDKLQDIFIISHCQFISGLTCKVTYNGKAPLPSEVFFTEFDAKGQLMGKKTRLIYPHLNPGERGTATFMLRGVQTGEPAKVVLTGAWNGPGKDPY